MGIDYVMKYRLDPLIFRNMQKMLTTNFLNKMLIMIKFLVQTSECRCTMIKIRLFITRDGHGNKITVFHIIRPYGNSEKSFLQNSKLPGNSHPH